MEVKKFIPNEDTAMLLTNLKPGYMIQQINSIQDVVTFVTTIATEIEDANPFKEFSSLNIYTAEEAAIRDKLMERCFEICATQTLNFKSLMLVLMEEALNNPAPNLIKSIIKTHVYDTAN